MILFKSFAHKTSCIETKISRYLQELINNSDSPKIWFLGHSNYSKIQSPCSPANWTLKLQWCWTNRGVCQASFLRNAVCDFAPFYSGLYCIQMRIEQYDFSCGIGLQVIRDLTFETLECTYLRSRSLQLLFLQIIRDSWTCKNALPSATYMSNIFQFKICW